MNDPHKYDINQQGISKQNPSLQVFLLLFILLRVLLLLFVCVCACASFCVCMGVCVEGGMIYSTHVTKHVLRRLVPSLLKPPKEQVS